MPKVETVKGAVGTTVSLGVGMIVSSAIKTLVPRGRNLPTRFLIGTGSFFLVGALAEFAADKAEETIQVVVDTYRLSAQAVQEAKRAVESVEIIVHQTQENGDSA